MPSDNNLKAQNTMSAILLIIALIGAMSCRECPTEPENHNNNQPDTTSHEMTWFVDTLKTGITSSIVRDVAVIDEDNIWAVGEFWIGDTVFPNGFKTYKCNVVTWNGTKWQYGCLFVDNGNYYLDQEMTGIIAFSDKDIWITDGALRHGNGERWTLYHPWKMGLLNEDEGGILAMWGASSDDVYFVGYDGCILHWNGTSLSRMASPTTKDLTSIAGTKGVIWACGYDPFTGSTEFIEYRNSSWKKKELPGGWPGSIGSYLSVGAYGDTLYLAGQSCLLVESVKNPERRRKLHYSWIDESDEYDVRFSFNDMVVLGYSDIFFSNGFGNIYHYNGSTLHKYPVELDGWMTGIDGKDNMVVAVGFDYKTAYVFRGYR